MIEHARKIPAGTVIRSDICIVGGGAAGIAIARELAPGARRVVLLAGGDRRERDDDRDLYRGEVGEGTSHEPLEEGRRRAWGGSTVAWHGRCVPLDPIDFEHRAWIPGSGWPIGYDQLTPYLERANELCEAGPFHYNTEEALPDAPAEMISGFDGADMVSSRLERWSPPTNFAKRYGPAIEKAPGVRILLGAHAQSLNLAGNHTAVADLRAKTSRGSEFSVVADTYVLACGGLENARLLLASRHQVPAGIGNGADNVGRYYMSHLFGVLGWIELRSPATGFVYDFERDRHGVYCRRRFWLTPKAQSEHGVGNSIGSLIRSEITDPSHEHSLLSATYLAQAYRDAIRDRGSDEHRRDWRAARPTRRSHWNALVRGAPALLPDLATTVRSRYLARRRLPVVLGPKSANHFPVQYQAEHLPHRASRVVLAADRDALGMPRLQTRIAFTDDDVRTAETFHRVLAAQLEATGTGVFHAHNTDLAEEIASDQANFSSWYHHLGTTRMSVSPSDGVVDRDCRVHGIDNLYVAGGSVFPTAGHANPTLTLVALALRLADHLRRTPTPAG